MKLFLSMVTCWLLAVPSMGRVADLKSAVEVNLPEGNSHNVLYQEKDGHRVVEVIYANDAKGELQMVDCFLAGDRHVIDLLVSELPVAATETLSHSAMSKLVDSCSLFLLKGMKNGDFHQFTRGSIMQGRGFLESLAIYPGTKWCGAGNVAADYDDLGSSKEADACCRTHDHCADNIPALGEKYGLKNKALYTKSHCDCDREFNGCLKKASDNTANSVGRLYCNLLQVQCFENNHPIKKCLRYSGWIPWIHWSCQEYELDTNGEHKWQFFDAKYYE